MRSIFLSFLFSIFATAFVAAQQPLFTFGDETPIDQGTSKKKANPEPIQWVQVNTEDNTWKVSGSELICTGNPIGVVRTKNEYENFILHIEWKHAKAGGNSGVFVWSKAVIAPNRLPDGVEAQILELDWIKLNVKDGVTPPEARVHGEMFGMGGVKVTADNPSGNKSFPVEFLAKGKGEWNTYDLVCVDGTIKLAVNGKFVNGLSKVSQTKGYICLESEGSEISFRNIRITKLP
jgi:hypothetical protein